MPALVRGQRGLSCPGCARVATAVRLDRHIDDVFAALRALIDAGDLVHAGSVDEPQLQWSVRYRCTGCQATWWLRLPERAVGRFERIG